MITVGLKHTAIGNYGYLRAVFWFRTNLPHQHRQPLDPRGPADRWGMRPA